MLKAMLMILFAFALSIFRVMAQDSCKANGGCDEAPEKHAMVQAAIHVAKRRMAIAQEEALPECHSTHAGASYVYPCMCGANTCRDKNEWCVDGTCVTAGGWDCAYDKDGRPRSERDYEDCCSSIYVDARGSDGFKGMALCVLSSCGTKKGADGGPKCTMYGSIAIGGRDSFATRYSRQRMEYMKTTFQGVTCDPMQDVNCIHPPAEQEYSSVRLESSAQVGLYTSEVMAKCAKEAGTFTVQVNKMSGMRMEVFINGVSKHVWDQTISRATFESFDQSSSDNAEFDLIRIEIEKTDASGNADFNLMLNEVTAFFDRCMNTKECLGTLVGEHASALRQDNVKQLQCLQGTLQDPASAAACNAWLACTDREQTKPILVGLLMASVPPYVKVGQGYCDWHYKDGGHIGVADCSELCKAERNCKVFTYGSQLGCRYSACGSYPGPDACPADRQCPIATEHSHNDKYEIQTEAALLQSSASPTVLESQLHQRVNKTTDESAMACPDDGPPHCISPLLGDAEAWECDCKETLEEECTACAGYPSANWESVACVECVRNHLCSSDRVCNSWKRAVGCRCDSRSLLQDANSIGIEQGVDKLHDSVESVLERKSNQC